MAVRIQARRFTVDEYSKMGEAGIIGEDDRVELIEGEIVEMPPISSPHGGGVNRLSYLLNQRLGDRALISVQNPLRLSTHSEPVPDLVVLRPRDDFYATSHPEATDVLLLIEVAQTSQRYDRRVKMPLYAREGVPESWLLDVPARALEVHRDPSPDGYRTVERLRAGDRVSPQALPDLTLAVEEITG